MNMFAAIHNFIMGIGNAVIGFFLNIDWSSVKNALSITVTGWLGIFVVTIVIILVVLLLSKVSTMLSKEEK